MEKAIKKAIEGGYALPKSSVFVYHSGSHVREFLDKGGKDFLLDPDFWQCLGKAEGWNQNIKLPRYFSEVVDYNNTYGDFIISKYQHGYKEEPSAMWVLYMHLLIDRLADGGNVDDFFNSLLK